MQASGRLQIAVSTWHTINFTATHLGIQMLLVTCSKEARTGSSATKRRRSVNCVCVCAGKANITAVGLPTSGLGDAPEAWSYLESGNPSYMFWVPVAAKTFIQAQQDCQLAGGLLFDIPQVMRLPSDATFRVDATIAVDQLGRALTGTTLHGLINPI
jgi:hypothetical protein